jgi:hypothetical protein
MIRKQVEQEEVVQWSSSVEEHLKELACQGAWEQGDKEWIVGGEPLKGRMQNGTAQARNSPFSPP